MSSIPDSTQPPTIPTTPAEAVPHTPGYAQAVEILRQMTVKRINLALVERDIENTKYLLHLHENAKRELEDEYQKLVECLGIGVAHAAQESMPDIAIDLNSHDPGYLYRRRL